MSDVHVKSVRDTLGLVWIRMVYWIVVGGGFMMLKNVHPNEQMLKHTYRM